MKKIFLLGLSFISISVFGQVYQAMPQPGYGPVKRFLTDSFGVLTLPLYNGSLNNITGGRDLGQARYRQSDSTLVLYTGSQWLGMATQGALSLKLNLSDTASMLTKYLRKQDSLAGGYYPYSSNPLGYLTTVTSLPISGLSAAISTNNINNSGYKQKWNWNSLTNDTALVISSNTTGALTGNTGLAITMSGTNSNANQQTYGAIISNTHTGSGGSTIGYGLYTEGVDYGIYSTSLKTAGIGIYGLNNTANGIGVAGVNNNTGTGLYGANSSTGKGIYGLNTNAGTGILAENTGTTGTGYALRSLKTGAATNNYAGLFQATGGTNNYALVTTGGLVGINTSTPDSGLTINTGMRYANGTQGPGKILTSDAVGGASWVNASSLYPSLQQVTDVGNITTNEIHAFSVYGDGDFNGLLDDGSITAYGYALNNSSGRGTSFTDTTSSISTSENIYMPNIHYGNATLPLSVNGQFADAAGNINTAGQKFGKDDVNFAENRYVNGHNTYGLTLDSLIAFSANGIYGSPQIYFDDAETDIYSPGGTESIYLGSNQIRATTNMFRIQGFTPFLYFDDNNDDQSGLIFRNSSNVEHTRFDVEANGDYTALLSSKYPGTVAYWDMNTKELFNTGKIHAANNFNSDETPHLLSTTTGINAKTIATTNLYTVAAGKTAIITGAIVSVTTATAITVAPTLGIGIAAGEDDIFAPVVLTGLNATNKIYAFNALGTYAAGAATNIIKLGVDVGATATTMTITVDLIGYLK